jgi:hypothetical protein
MAYNFPIPRSRGCKTTREDSENKCYTGCIDGEEFNITSMILHALIGRMTASNGTTYEFETLYDPELKAMEIDIPSCYLDYIETISVGPNIQRYLQWLVGLAFGGLANNLYWAGSDELIDLGSGSYETPHRFYEDTLAVFINGKKLDKNLDNGFVVINDTTFQLKQPGKGCNEKITVGYMKNE